MCLLTNNKQISFERDYLNSYLNTKPSNCILYSEDGAKFEIHKELLGQTKFMREILNSAKDHCSSTLEIVCPCSKVELEKLVYFLYHGEIHCEDIFDSNKVQENLSKIFGYPELLNIEKDCSDLSFKLEENSNVVYQMKYELKVEVKEELLKDLYIVHDNSNQNEKLSEGQENGKLKEERYFDEVNEEMGIDFITSKTFDKEYYLKTRKIQEQEKTSKNSDNSICQDISDSIFEKFKASEKLFVKTKNKVDNANESPPTTIEEPKVVTGDELIKLASGTVEEPYKCLVCSDSFGSISAAIKHFKTVHQILKPHKCSICGSSFRKSSHLKQHINAAHFKLGPEILKSHKCRDCGSNFVNSSMLKDHINAIHLKSRPFKCTQCLASFARKFNMKDHCTSVHKKSKNKVEQI